MLELNRILKNNNLIPKKYIKKDDDYIVETNTKKLIIKKHKSDIYKYLNSRNFNYFPKVITNYDYDIIEYMEDISLPPEQKILDLIKLVSLLHNKTTYYKEIDNDYLKKIYEGILNEIEIIKNFYNKKIHEIDNNIYMSPSESLLASNISKVFAALDYSLSEIDVWYNLIKEKTKIRYAVINNDLKLENFIDSQNKYIVNWDKSYFGIPIFDIYNMYKNYALDYDFESILKVYEKEYPLLAEERKLLFILISLPSMFKESQSEYEKCLSIFKIINYIDKTNELISPYYLKYTEDKKQIKN